VTPLSVRSAVSRFRPRLVLLGLPLGGLGSGGPGTQANFSAVPANPGNRIAVGSALAQRTWSTATPAIALAAGDRLTLRLTWQAVKACNSTFLHMGGTTYRSRVAYPQPR
jgi:hypothetical protein